MQAYLGDIIAHSVPDCHNKGNIAIKQVILIYFVFPVHIKVMFTLSVHFSSSVVSNSFWLHGLLAALHRVAKSWTWLCDWTELIDTHIYRKLYLASLVALDIKNPPSNTGDISDMDLISGLGWSPGWGHGNPLQYSCLENPKDRGAW